MRPKIPQSEVHFPGPGNEGGTLLRRLELTGNMQPPGDGLKSGRALAGLMARFPGLSGAVATVTYDLSLAGLKLQSGLSVHRSKWIRHDTDKGSPARGDLHR